ncbi:hypothetical protein CYMTET_47880 [Cymbomonas tetramitiformis]|uniref:Uncharacterized protein n=1 Tax=Cymbomonas tetramitiformis TaxID=36881 RepID=A0AAE0EW69_9CHLO|nr:hypothetical protein CYMTET_47880 [Cymbomonas tetramitiformis]
MPRGGEKKVTYLHDLEEQIRLREEQRARDKAEDERLDKVARQQQLRHFPWDKGSRGGGGGDPCRDAEGNIVTNLRGRVQQDDSDEAFGGSNLPHSREVDVHESNRQAQRADIRSRRRLPAATSDGLPREGNANSLPGSKPHSPPRTRPSTAERYRKELQSQIDDNRRAHEEPACAVEASTRRT